MWSKAVDSSFNVQVCTYLYLVSVVSIILITYTTFTIYSSVREYCEVIYESLKYTIAHLIFAKEECIFSRFNGLLFLYPQHLIMRG